MAKKQASSAAVVVQIAEPANDISPIEQGVNAFEDAAWHLGSAFARWRRDCLGAMPASALAGMAPRQSRRHRANAEPRCQAASSNAFTPCSIGEMSLAGSAICTTTAAELACFLATERLLKWQFQAVI